MLKKPKVVNRKKTSNLKLSKMLQDGRQKRRAAHHALVVRAPLLGVIVDFCWRSAAIALVWAVVR